MATCVRSVRFSERWVLTFQKVKRQKDLEEAKKIEGVVVVVVEDRCSLDNSNLKINSSLPDDNTSFAVCPRYYNIASYGHKQYLGLYREVKKCIFMTLSFGNDRRDRLESRLRVLLAPPIFIGGKCRADLYF